VAAYDFPLLLKHILTHGVGWAPDQEIIYRGQVRLTYSAMYQRVLRLGGALRALGVTKGSKVGVIEWDSHRYLEMYFGIPGIGAILHTINPRLAPEDLVYTVAHAEDEVLIFHEDFLPLVERLRPRATTIRKYILLTDKPEKPDIPWIDAEYEALLAGATTAVAPIVFWQAQFIQIDAFFTALLFAAFLAQMLVDLDPGRRERWVWAFHVLLPLAVLTKGPLAIVLTGLVALVRCALSRSLRPVLDLRPFRGALVSAALVVPWYWFATRAGGPEYTYDLIVKQNWIRFFHAFDHIKPWWFYLGSIWGDFVPWTLPALVAPFTLRSSGLLSRRPELKWGLTIVLTCFVFLSTSQSKQGKYLLIAYPFAAVLLAAAVGEWERRASQGLRLFRGYLLFVAGLFLGAALAVGPVAARRSPEFAHLAPLVALPLGIGAAGTFWVLWRRRGEAAPAALALAATLAAGEAVAGPVLFRALDVAKTGRPFYDRVQPLVGDPAVPLVYWGNPYRSYPMLRLRRHTDHVVTETALAEWLKANPRGFVLADSSAFEKWKEPELVRLRVVDRQPTGQDKILLLERP